jgi:hypothetical protein
MPLMTDSFSSFFNTTATPDIIQSFRVTDTANPHEGYLLLQSGDPKGA